MVRARDDHPRFPAALARAGAGIADRHRLHGPRCWAANRTGSGVGRICRHRKRRRIAAAPAAGPPLAIPRAEQDVFRRRCRVVPVSRSPRLSKHLMAAAVAAQNIKLVRSAGCSFGKPRKSENGASSSDDFDHLLADSPRPRPCPLRPLPRTSPALCLVDQYSAASGVRSRWPAQVRSRPSGPTCGNSARNAAAWLSIADRNSSAEFRWWFSGIGDQLVPQRVIRFTCAPDKTARPIHDGSRPQSWFS